MTGATNRTMTFSPGALAGLLLMLPFALLELWHRSSGSESLANSPFSLFVLMWALPMVAVNALASVVRRWTLPASPMHPAGFFLHVACAAIAAGVWMLLVQDQWPCFMGAPNCD
jgi:hypothetical protein